MSTWTPSISAAALRAAAKRRKSNSHPHVSPLEPRQLLSGTPPVWQQADIGTTGTGGWSSVTGSSLSILGAGTGDNGGADAGHFSYIQLTGDGEIDAQLTNGGLPSGGLIALMMRTSLDPRSADVSVQWTSADNIAYEHRLTNGGMAAGTTPYPSQASPTHLRLVRYGTQIAAYESTDGSSWTTVGSDTINLGQSIDIGVFASGGATGVAGWAWANVTVGPVTQPFTTSWVGNTFGGGDAWVQGEIGALYVMPNGTVYTDSDWDEGGHEAGIYQNGQEIGALQDTHGWNRTGGDAITSDGTYIYTAMEQAYDYGAGGDYPGPGVNWFCIRRYNLNGTPAPFPGGRGWDSSMIIASTTNPVTGLAVAGNKLVATVAGDNKVLTYDLQSLVPSAYWSVPNAGAVTAATDGTIWVAAQSGSEPPAVVHFDVYGDPYSDRITGVGDPTALSTTPSGNLLVADDGPAKQVIEYTTYTNGASPSVVATFGDYGGLLSGTPGAVTPTKWDGLAGVGMDAAGNLVVSTSSYGATIRSFPVVTSPAGVTTPGVTTLGVTENWELNGLEFVDVADADPASDGTSVYSEFHQYTINPNAPAGQQWSLAATTVDAAAYPEDPRLLNNDTDGLGLSTVMIREVGGVKLMYITDEFSSSVVIYRFNGDIAVPAAMYARNPEPGIPNSPASGAWLWVDSNGDGSFQASEFTPLGLADDTQWGISVDSNGTIWLASSANGVKSIPVTGFNAFGVPRFNAAAGTATPVPGDFTELTRAIYDPSTDSMYLGGYSWDAPHTGSEWGELGTTIARYNNWSTDPTLAWETLLPYSPNSDPSIVAKSMAVAGGKVFAGISQTGQILEYDAGTGALDDTIYPGPEVAGLTGWFDTTNAINAFQQSDGQIDVFAEEVTQSKVIEYELTQAAPTALSAAVTTTASGTGGILLTWTAPAGATGYEISRSTDGVNFAVLGDSTAAVYTDTTATAGIAYTYRVRAFGSYAESAPSAVATGEIPASPVLRKNPVVGTSSVTGAVPLSHLTIQSASSGWGKVSQSTSAGPAVGDIAYLGPSRFSTPVAQYPSADVIVRLDSNYTIFTGSTGVFPGGTASGTVTFEVLADGTPVYTSGPEAAGQKPVAFSVNVAGVTVLDLRIINDGDGSGFDHADWAGPTLIVGQTTLLAGASPSGGSSTNNASSGSLYATLPLPR